MNEKITSSHLQRIAYVYVRQSTTHQVRHHRESRQRQYALATRAQELGFAQTVVIDEDQGKSGSGVGADRDFRVTMQNPDGTWREVPSELWKEESNRIVSKLSGGRSLDQLNWRATDRFDIEASPDYATQNGQIANITRVIRGKTTLKDSKQFGNMWQQKMSGVELDEEGRLIAAPPLEGVAQAQKACSTLTAVRGGYQQQGYNVGNLTPQMQKGIQIVQGADVTGTGDYNSVNQALQKAGFKDGFNEFANKVASQFQALGMARKG